MENCRRIRLVGHYFRFLYAEGRRKIFCSVVHSCQHWSVPAAMGQVRKSYDFNSSYFTFYTTTIINSTTHYLSWTANCPSVSSPPLPMFLSLIHKIAHCTKPCQHLRFPLLRSQQLRRCERWRYNIRYCYTRSEADLPCYRFFGECHRIYIKPKEQVWTHFCARFNVVQLHTNSSKQLINDTRAERLSECAPFLPNLNLELSGIPSSDVKLPWYGKMRRYRPALTKALCKFKSLTSLCNIIKYKRNRNQFLFRFCYKHATSFSRG
jgi:hypothetical protein